MNSASTVLLVKFLDNGSISHHNALKLVEVAKLEGKLELATKEHTMANKLIIGECIRGIQEILKD